MRLPWRSEHERAVERQQAIDEAIPEVRLELVYQTMLTSMNRGGGSLE
jgi:hypothetical protein